MRSSTRLWICNDILEGAPMTEDALSDVWAQLAIVMDGRSGDFYFLRYVVEREE